MIILAVPTVIVDGKNSAGKRLSVSMDAALWALFVAAHDQDSSRARKAIKSLMLDGEIKNSYDAKKWIYSEIARPTLLLELQTELTSTL